MNAPAERTLVADLALAPVVVVTPDTSVRAAARVLAEPAIAVIVVGAMPLFEVTEHDIVVAFAAGVAPEAEIGALRHSPPEFVSPSTCLSDVANRMLATGRHELVVSDGVRTFGVVTLDVVTAALWGPTTMLGALGAVLHVREDL